jgi:hypothetical protein
MRRPAALAAVAAAMFGAILAAGGVAAQPAGSPAVPSCGATTGIHVEGATLCFAGIISRASADEAVALIAGQRLDTMVVTSDGGEVTAALRLARAIRAHGLTLVVKGRCVSSCANFLFTGARRKIVAPQSLVVFHGGIAPPAFGGLFGGGADERDLRTQTEAFFREIGVNGSLTYDQPPLAGSPDGAEEWTASPRALARYGVGGIVSMWWPSREAVVAAGRAQGMRLGVLD